MRGPVSMRLREFDKSLHALQRQTPFRPFTVVLVNGERVRVDRADALVCRNGNVVFVAAGGQPTLFDHSSVSEPR